MSGEKKSKSRKLTEPGTEPESQNSDKSVDGGSKAIANGIESVQNRTESGSSLHGTKNHTGSGQSTDASDCSEMSRIVITQQPQEFTKISNCVQCRNCFKVFATQEDFQSDNGKCPNAANNYRYRIDRCCCVKVFNAPWYHLTKDNLQEHLDIGRCDIPPLSCRQWALFVTLNVLCCPCLCLWWPLNLCEHVASLAGMTGSGPHDLVQPKEQSGEAYKNVCNEDE